MEIAQVAMNYLRPVLEILILTFLIYKILYYMRGTRGLNILAGLVIILLLLSFLTDLLKFDVVSWLLNGLWALLATAIIVIFQPELRRAFAQLGSTPFHMRNRRKQEAISEVVTAVLNMAKRRNGAIIVFERQIGMRGIIEDSIKLDARLNSYLIESIFYPNSPLHDGSIIIKDDKIVAAHSILPLSRDETLMKTLGTRHRAAVGITEETDAVALVVSEETGTISLATRGKIKRDIKAGQLRRLLNALLLSSSSKQLSNIFSSVGEDDDEALDGFANDEEEVK